MSSTDDDLAVTSELAARFMRVFESSFKRMAHRKHPNSLFKDLSINKLQMLNLLHRQPGTAQKELALLLDITPAAVSTAVREMATMGLVERQPDEQDARVMRLYLSDEANRIIGESTAQRHNAIAQLLSVLPIEEQHMIVTSLEKALLIYTSNDNPEGDCCTRSEHSSS